MKWLIGLIVNALVLLGLAELFSAITVAGVGAALLASFILSLANAFIKPILVILTLPITILTLGLFLFVINAILLKLTAAVMGSSFVITGLGMAILASIILTIVQTVVVKPLRKK